MNEKFWILIQISLKIVPKGLIDNKTALVQIMAWRRRNRQQAIIWTNVDPIQWRIYVTQEGDELTLYILILFLGNIINIPIFYDVDDAMIQGIRGMIFTGVSQNQTRQRHTEAIDRGNTPTDH